MKPSIGPLFIIATTMLYLAGCDPEDKPHQKKPPGGFTPAPHHEQAYTDPGEVPSTGENTPPPAEHHDRPPQNVDTVPSKPTPPPATGNPEYAKAVPGKPGFVTSPYAPYAGLVDVRGFAPGTELKDPYSERTFLVPAQ